MVDQAERLSVLFEKNPYAAFLALACLAIVALFSALLLSMRANLRTSQQIIPIAEGLKQTIDRNNDVLEDTVEVLDRAVLIAEIRSERSPRATRRGRAQVPQPATQPTIKGEVNVPPQSAAVDPVAAHESERSEEDPPAGE